MTEFKLELRGPALQDISDITDYTQERYGAVRAVAYQTVILRALRDIQKDPMRPGSKDRSEDLQTPRLRSYHIALSKNRAN